MFPSFFFQLNPADISIDLPFPFPSPPFPNKKGAGHAKESYIRAVRQGVCLAFNGKRELGSLESHGGLACPLFVFVCPKGRHTKGAIFNKWIMVEGASPSQKKVRISGSSLLFLGFGVNPFNIYQVLIAHKKEASISIHVRGTEMDTVRTTQAWLTSFLLSINPVRFQPITTSALGGQQSLPSKVPFDSQFAGREATGRGDLDPVTS